MATMGADGGQEQVLLINEACDWYDDVDDHHDVMMSLSTHHFRSGVWNHSQTMGCATNKGIW
jgi:hypothetical protein